MLQVGCLPPLAMPRLSLTAQVCLVVIPRYVTHNIQQFLLNFKKILADDKIAAGNSISFPETSNNIEVLFSDSSVPIVFRRLGNQLAAFFRAFEDKVELILLIFSSAIVNIYNRIKALGNKKYGIHTACVLNTKTKNMPYLANVALKNNAKLQGINYPLRPDELGIISKNRTIVVGIHVSHPGLRSEDSITSTAAMVASLDRLLSQ